MPFTSLEYLLFLTTVYLVYFFVGERFRWGVLLAASYIFYATWKVPYLLAVITLVSLTTYGFGIWIDQATSARAKRYLLWAGIAANVMILVVMKYLPFLSENLKSLSTLLSVDTQFQPIKAFATIGVSYYIFQAISYLFDIYLEIEKPEHHLGYFALYLAFFPKLLQGPIERAGELLPQLKNLKKCDVYQLRSGLFLIIIGLFKKIVIADRIGIFVNPVFANVHNFSGMNLLIATYAYAFQIYFDFSGYTDMALGCAQLFNINLTQNFNSPYLARSVAEFWRRWHISFSRWILDYIFKPLQMQWRNWKNWGTALALLFAFLISGIWHGASWGFVIWGGLHGLYLACSVFYKPYQKKLHKFFRAEKTSILKVWQIIVTFNLICLAWIFFRANTVRDAWYIITHLFTGSFTTSSIAYDIEIMSESGSMKQELLVLVISLGLWLASARIGHKKILDRIINMSCWLRFSLYYAIVMYLLLFGYFTKQSFAYVRF